MVFTRVWKCYYRTPRGPGGDELEYRIGIMGTCCKLSLLDRQLRFLIRRTLAEELLEIYRPFYY